MLRCGKTSTILLPRHSRFPLHRTTNSSSWYIVVIDLRVGYVFKHCFMQYSVQECGCLPQPDTTTWTHWEQQTLPEYIKHGRVKLVIPVLSCAMYWFRLSGVYFGSNTHWTKFRWEKPPWLSWGQGGFLMMDVIVLWHRKIVGYCVCRM